MESYLSKKVVPPKESGGNNDARENKNNFAALPLGFLEELAQSNSLEDILLCTSYWIREIFQADRSSIALRENDAYLKLYALDGNDILPKDCLIPIQSSFVGQVFSQQKTAISPDNRKSNMIDCQWLVDGGLLCCMDTPLKYKEECYGTLNVAHKQVDSYSEIDAKILETIAKWVAAQIYKHKQINKMIELAHLDPLTGALNRRAFVEATYFINDKPRQYDHKTALLMLDLDKFKAINDAYGHPVGDKVLIEIAQILKNSVRSDDLVARLGGEEFAILLRHVNADEALRLAELLRAMVEQTVVEHQNQAIHCTISIGIALPLPTDQGFEELMQRADNALYVAKRKGRNQIILSGMSET
ncbi:sensor domain-containing diguanylate cyclase [Vibrio vulnificus]|uniref:sensor domain-containing diguanylate cyclase n=1 Tax=Vibrio vulnificus TaxID=672 RepID=UPI000CD15173|nr:sensor domain-containing diguanylate cyclase [Vibrio vulnificus]AVX01956.1 GGDEF domain-containing protein [Vibrio vulnificus Env1]EGQ7983099.1 sensor domain-containing diguanylate cyclase [Vibrio vulnificus]EGQ9276294.1 sensor domain-containing diguanylate cyclase [Vibrio vulnificus]EGQ9993237.1 sensor domain-containing diguanylate cyclase [Vibrio vulnificus]EHZ7123244.1 sensor domain-containing diguanylate cyclase [Vibrio vulnificus]